MSDATMLLAGSTYRAESYSDTPIFRALFAADPLFSPFVVYPDTGRRVSTPRDPASLRLSCFVSRRTVVGRHQLSATIAEHAPRTGRHHLLIPSYV
jgi:hypothetical protein